VDVQDREEEIPENASEILERLKFNYSDAEGSQLSKAKLELQ
jgi:hypothetical protein